VEKATAARFFGQAAIWGASFTFIKFALEDFSPNQLVLFRLILGAATLAAIIVLTGRSFKLSGNAWFHVAVSSIFANVIPYLLLSYGKLHTSAGLAGVLIGGTPLVTLFISTLALRAEPATSRKVAGFILGFLGVVLVVAPWKVEGSSLLGALACFGAATSYCGELRLCQPLSVALEAGSHHAWSQPTDSGGYPSRTGPAVLRLARD